VKRSGPEEGEGATNVKIANRNGTVQTSEAGNANARRREVLVPNLKKLLLVAKLPASKRKKEVKTIAARKAPS